MKGESQRLFTAIALPDQHKKKLRHWVEQDLSNLSFRKWSDFRDYHVTLQFLGDVANSVIPKLEQALVHAAAEHRPFTLGMGPYRPHITVARSYTGGEPVSASVWQSDDRSGEPWEVGEFVLYATRMGQKPMYQIIQTFPLMR